MHIIVNGTRVRATLTMRARARSRKIERESESKRQLYVQQHALIDARDKKPTERKV